MWLANSTKRPYRSGRFRVGFDQAFESARKYRWAGITDTGVHAKEMVAHFDWNPALAGSIKDLNHLVHRLNRFLDPAIRVYHAVEVAADWHARFDAMSRSYEYLMCDNGSPFQRKNAWMVEKIPDVVTMNMAASLLLEQRDFASFCKKGSDIKTTLCKVSKAQWDIQGDFGCFTFLQTVSFATWFVQLLVHCMKLVWVNGRWKNLRIDFFKKIGCNGN